MTNQRKNEKQFTVTIYSPINIPELIKQDIPPKKYYSFKDIKFLILRALNVKLNHEQIENDICPDIYEKNGERLTNMDIFDALQDAWPEIGKGKNDKFTVDAQVKWYIPR